MEGLKVIFNSLLLQNNIPGNYESKIWDLPWLVDLVGRKKRQYLGSASSKGLYGVVVISLALHDSLVLMPNVILGTGIIKVLTTMVPLPMKGNADNPQCQGCPQCYKFISEATGSYFYSSANRAPVELLKHCRLRLQIVLQVMPSVNKWIFFG